MGVLDEYASKLGAGLVGQLTSGLAGAALVVVLARLLSPTDYGLLFLAISIFSVVSLLSNLGIAKSAARFIAEYRSKQPGQLRHIAKVGFVYLLVSSTVVFALLVLFRETIASYFGEPRLTKILFVGGVFVVLSPVYKYVRIVYQGFEYITTGSILHAGNAVSRLVIAVVLVKAGYGVLGALGGYLVAFAFVSVVGLFLLHKKLQTFEVADAIESDLPKRILRYNVPLAVTNAADVLDKEVDTVLVGYFLSPVHVGFYTVGKQIERFLEIPATAMGFTLSPAYGSYKSKGKKKQASRLYEEAVVSSLVFYVPAGAGIFLLAQPTILLFFGESYLEAVPILQVFSLYAVIRSVIAVTDNGLDYLGKAKVRSVIIIFTTVLNIGLNVVTIPVFGAVGAAASTTVAQFIYLSANIYAIRLELDVDLLGMLQPLSKVVLVASVMAVAVSRVTTTLEGLLSLVVAVSVGTLVWIVSIHVTKIVDVRDYLQ